MKARCVESAATGQFLRLAVMSDSVHSKMPGFLGYLAPVIVTPVAVSNRRRDKLLRVGVVE